MTGLTTSIAGLMAVVTLAALDCVAVRSPLSGRSLTGVLWLVGGLPMANVLTVGLLPLLLGRPRRWDGRPFLVGFVALGALALMLYAALTARYAGPFREALALALRP